MERIKGTNAQFLAELFYFIWLLIVIFLAWQNNLLLLFAVLGGTVLSLLFWHHKEDIIFFLVGALVGSVLQMILTDQGMLIYTNPGILGVPYWIPFFYGGIMLFAKRFKDSFFELEHWQKHYERPLTIKDFEKQIFPELMYFILLILIIKYLSYSNIAAFLFLLIILMLQVTRWHKREDYIYAIVLFVLGTLIDLIGVNIGIWRWSVSTFFGVPIWVGLSYKYMGLLTRRICVTLNHKLFVKQK